MKFTDLGAICWFILSLFLLVHLLMVYAGENEWDKKIKEALHEDDLASICRFFGYIGSLLDEFFLAGALVHYYFLNWHTILYERCLDYKGYTVCNAGKYRASLRSFKLFLFLVRLKYSILRFFFFFK